MNAQQAIPNVYIAGRPLWANSKVFKGRRDIFDSLTEKLKFHSNERSATVLYGQRRTGKTSILLRLDVVLPQDIVPIFIDMQGIFSKTTTDLLWGIAYRMKEALEERYNRPFPELTRDSLLTNPYFVFNGWLDTIEKMIGNDSLLLAIDEYEELDRMIRNEHLDESFLMFINNLVEERDRLRLVFCGAHTFEDLSTVWGKNIKKVHFTKVGYLNNTDGRELILKPTPEFDLSYENDAVEEILQTSNCHPYLIQAMCRNLIDTANELGVRRITLEIVDKIIIETIDKGYFFFENLFWECKDDDYFKVIIELAYSQRDFLDYAELRKQTNLNDDVLHAALNRLVERDLLGNDEDKYFFKIKLFRLWIEKIFDQSGKRK